MQKLTCCALLLATATALIEAGCTGDRLTNQRVPRSKEPNVISTLPGEGQALS
jgi:hypothetical protein